MGNIKLAWGGWLYGLVGGFIGGGASAASTAIAEIYTSKGPVEPDHLTRLTFVSFLVGGAIATFAFLKQSPLPSVEVTAKEVTTVPVEGGGTKTTVLNMTGTLPQGEDKK